MCFRRKSCLTNPLLKEMADKYKGTYLQLIQRRNISFWSKCRKGRDVLSWISHFPLFDDE